MLGRIARVDRASWARRGPPHPPPGSMFDSRHSVAGQVLPLAVTRRPPGTSVSVKATGRYWSVLGSESKACFSEPGLGRPKSEAGPGVVSTSTSFKVQKPRVTSYCQ